MWAHKKEENTHWVFLYFSYEYITNLRFIKPSALITRAREGNGHL